MSKFEVSTSRLFPYIGLCLVESVAHSPKFTHRFTRIQDCGFRTNWYEIGTFRFTAALKGFRYLIMSQTLSKLVSLQSGPDAAAGTLAQYPTLPVTHHHMEEGTSNSRALAVEDVVAWAASLDPTLEVIHINLRSTSHNSYFGGKAWSMNVWRELRLRVLCVRFLHLLPQPATMDQLLNAMRTNRVGKPKDAHIQVYPTTDLVHPPPPSIATWCAFKIWL